MNPKYDPGCQARQPAASEKRGAFLLEHGVDPNLEIRMGKGEVTSALCLAVGNGVPNLVRQLIAHNASCSAACSPLHSAADYRTPETLCALIACGTPVNERDQRGRTALFNAADNGRLENVSVLLDYGADPSLEDAAGYTAMSLIQPRHQPAVARLLKSWTKPGAHKATHSRCTR
jgi:ankyrin repeat protein